MYVDFELFLLGIALYAFCGFMAGVYFTIKANSKSRKILMPTTKQFEKIFVRGEPMCQVTIEWEGHAKKTNMISKATWAAIGKVMGWK